jgi:hypothetical protein
VQCVDSYAQQVPISRHHDIEFIPSIRAYLKRHLGRAYAVVLKSASPHSALTGRPYVQGLHFVIDGALVPRPGDGPQAVPSRPGADPCCA